MSFNASKCKVLTVTRKLNPVNSDYHLEDKTLAPVRKETDLGVVITSNFTWEHRRTGQEIFGRGGADVSLPDSRPRRVS